ncbi:MAG: radical SAM protein [Promethearchaeota archaeon]|nr:MAG: radical SAM protein [Candidatus Lokiarchaeota archaeon]
MRKKNKNLKSVNLHFWPYCNMNCIYCFANFKNITKPLSSKKWINIINELELIDINKINFAGGEPTLCSFLGELIKYSKNIGLITSIISNGTGINNEFIKKFGKYIDWIGLSLDSGNENTQYLLGRGEGTHVKKIINKSKIIKEAGIKLKINSVITKLNYLENFSQIINTINPDRWKIFQVLEIKNQNSSKTKNFSINQKQFREFTEFHKHLNPILENNNMMIESYIMIDPLGRFYQNSNQIYHYSKPILDIGIKNAFNGIIFDYNKFRERGGLYYC